jgi:hypothetical protein
MENHEHATQYSNAYILPIIFIGSQNQLPEYWYCFYYSYYPYVFINGGAIPPLLIFSTALCLIKISTGKFYL